MNLSSLNLQARGPDLLFAVLVQPRAGRDAILTVREGVLKVAVTAPPVDGKANTACRRLLANALKIPVNRVEIFAGAQSRRKRIRIRHIDFEALKERLTPFLK